MTSAEFRARLRRQASKAGVIELPNSLADALETYYRLLARWNEKINLTSLDLNNPSDETLDRLVIEPLAAAQYAPRTATLAMDIGSGGGSPAIPFALAAPQLRLTLVESRSRKVVFLREAIRAVDLEDEVEQARFEDLAERQELRGRFDIITVRAVRLDPSLLTAARRLLAARGQLFLFTSPGEATELSGFSLRTYPLTSAGTLVIASG